MNEHIRTIVGRGLLAGLLAGLVSGCGGGGASDPGPGEGLGHDGGDLASDEADGERILWVGEMDGDLVLHARLGAKVAADHPDGDRFRIRFDVSGQAMYVEIVDAEDQVLDAVRVGELEPFMYPAQEKRVLSFCFPFPVVPPTTGSCTFSPCPWDDAWPDRSPPWPDCIEVSQASGMVRVVGAVGGTAIGQELTQGADPVPMFDTTFTRAQTRRVQTASAIAYDISTLAPEIDALEDPSTQCGLIGAFAAARASACGILELGACSDAFWAAMAYGDQC